ncbi:fizzy-related protein homolog [Dysidea avara]|uniref:fizzy-related protein homolog n=1 Tax=Dysidea avara TaxID=196820 RepID=UPI00331D14B2
MDPIFEGRLRNTLGMSSPKKTPQVQVYGSPIRSPACIKENGDRYIPSRSSPAFRRQLFTGDGNDEEKEQNPEPIKAESMAYQLALQNEILGESHVELPDPNSRVPLAQTSKSNLLHYQSPKKMLSTMAPYSVSPISKTTQKLLLSPRRATRKISKTPFKVLDAPDLQDDYYLNLLDWSSANVLSVGLGTAVYLWSAVSHQVTKLCDLQSEGDTITSVCWSEDGHLLAVGTHLGYVQIWDAAASKKVSTLTGHNGRATSLSWNSTSVASGSRDRTILQWDHRMTAGNRYLRKLTGHSQEVCGLRWSPDSQLLASGGNDNKLFIWDNHSSTPLYRFSQHNAAVKALAWSPHQHGLLVSGGGTVDRTIRFWNMLMGQPLHHVDTGSQVCNLAWSRNGMELVSTHGYSQNQILLWRYPSMTQIAKLTGHTTRVLYLAMSPDGQTIVTGAGDETLRFWNVFSKARSHKEPNSPLNIVSYLR